MNATRSDRTMRFPARVLSGIGLGWAILALLAGGCSLEPPGAPAQRRELREAGRPYEANFQARSLPELPAEPSWRDVLQRALLASGEVEAAYFEWAEACAAAQVTAAWPNPNLMVGYGYLFSGGNIKGWDRTTLTAGFDPSMNLQLPPKVMAAARAAYEAALAKARRLTVAKFALQQKALTAYFDFALAAEKLRIQTENAKLLKMVADIAEQRVRAGAAQQDLLRAQTEYEIAVNEQSNLSVELASLRAGLNGMMLLPADAALAAPAELPAARLLPGGDGDLLALAVRNNPELAALGKDVAAAEQALALARLGYLPDVNLQFAITGSVSQFLSGQVMPPLHWGKIEAGIAAARAALRRAEALERQGRSDVGSRFLITLLAVRNSERQVELFEGSIIPKARQSWDSTAKAYATGSATFADLLESERTLLTARLQAAEARMTREKRLAEMEALIGADVETMPQPAPGQSAQTQPATAPTAEPAP
jgi:outer membrane protein, heavy metal efflux system